MAVFVRVQKDGEKEEETKPIFEVEYPGNT